MQDGMKGGHYGTSEKESYAPARQTTPTVSFLPQPYRDARFTRCPQCEQPMRQRKLPLVIHIDPMQLLSLNKTCRYCPHCDLLIAHQNDVEHLVVSIFRGLRPEIVGNRYLVVGTMEKTVWKRGTHDPLTTQEMLEALYDFQDVVTFQPVGDWGQERAAPPVPK